MPSVSVKRGELGTPVKGLDGVLRSELDPSLLNAGDVIFFLALDYNLKADLPLFEKGGKKFGTWHMGLYHSYNGTDHWVIHANPGREVEITSLRQIYFDAIFVVRLPSTQTCGAKD
jgi:hypothetical protein